MHNSEKDYEEFLKSEKEKLQKEDYLLNLNSNSNE